MSEASPRVRWSFEGEIEVLTPLHVGTGETVTIPTVKGAEGQNEPPPQVAAIARDASNRPYIPSTAIKNLILRLTRDETARTLLQGEISKGDEDDAGAPPPDPDEDPRKGFMGALIARGAVRIHAPDVSAAPYVAGAEGELGQGVFVAARTAIDPLTGTAAHNKLFHAEMVAPGTRFRLRLLVERRGIDAADEADDAAQAVATALQQLARPEGAALGKGGADGFGLVRLKPKTVSVTRAALDHSGAMAPKPRPDVVTRIQAKPDAGKARSETVNEKRFELTCSGPFCIIDSSKRLTAAERAAKRKPGEPEDNAPQLVAQRLAENAPLLLGSSVSGALRARARRLAAIDAKTSEADVDKPEKVFQPNKTIDDLKATELLFGVTGWRGLLRIANLAVTSAETWDVTSVRLDRFSGAPIDNALFKTATFLGTTIKLTLAFDERPLKQRQDETDEQFAKRLAAQGDARDKAIEKARKLFNDLVEDLNKPNRPLLLGHGVNKGFGWFDVKVLP